MHRDSQSPPPAASSSSSTSRPPPPPTPSLGTAPLGGGGELPQFKFGKAPTVPLLGGRGLPLSFGMSPSGGGGGGGGGSRQGGTEGRGAPSSSRDRSPPRRRSSPPPGDETEDEGDSLVLASSSTSAPRSSSTRHVQPFRSSFGATDAASLKKEFQLNLPGSLASPPRAALPQRHPAGGGSTGGGNDGNGARRFVPGSESTSQGRSFHPAPQQQADHSASRRASSSASSKPAVASTSVPLPPDAVVRRSSAGQPQQQQQQHQHEQQSQPSTGTTPNPKKRARTNDAGAVATPAASGGGGGRTASTSGTAGRTTGRDGAASTGARANGGGQGGGGSGPAGKRRKQESAAGVDYRMVISDLQTLEEEKRSKDEEIRQLRSQLSEKTNEIQRLLAEAQCLAADKDKLKGEMTTRMRNALEHATAAADDFESTTSDMRNAMHSLKTDLGSATTAEQLKEDLNEVKTDLSNLFLSESHEVWLERNEESKISVLKGLSLELDRRQGVIDLLRQQLDTKTGELVETRSTVDDLTSRVERLDTFKTALQSEVVELRSAALDERAAASERLNEVTLESAALEEKHREKLSEVDLAWSEKIEDLREKDRVAREGEEVERKKSEEERRTFEEERRRYQDEIEGLKAERAEAREAERSRAGEARDELEQVQRELRSTVGDLEELKKRRDHLEQQHNFDTTHTDNLAAELRQVKANLADSEIANSKLRTAALAQGEAENKLVQELRQSREEGRSLEERNSTLVEQLNQAQQAASRIASERARAEQQDRETIKTLEETMSELQLQQAQIQKDAEDEKKRLEQTLDQANAALQVAQEQRSSTPDVDTVAEIAQLHAHVEELNKALSDATRDSYEAHEAKKQVEESLRTLRDSKDDQLSRASTRISQLEREVVDAQNKHTGQLQLVQQLQQQLEARRLKEEEFEVRLKEVQEKAIEEKKAAVVGAVNSCKGAAARESMQKSNELKRTVNKLEETTKRLNKVQNEFAKSKGAHVLNNHIASSSESGPKANSDDGAKPRPNGQAPPTNGRASRPAPAVIDPSSDLTAIDDGFDVDPEPVKPKAKKVEFDELPEKTKRRSSTSGGGGGGGWSSSTKKTVLKPKRPVAKKEEEDEEDDADITLVDEDEEEDDIETLHTQVQGQKGKARPSSSKTYARKKR